MNMLIENHKEILKFFNNLRGLFRRNEMLILMIFFVVSLSLLLVACSIAADSFNWDKPFSAPQYLLHATGHGTIDGPRTDDWWFLNPNQPKNGYIELPDGEGGTFTYSIDQFLGPYNTPREVCIAAGGKTKDNSVGGFNCKDLENPPESTNKPEEGPCANACDKSKHLVWDGYAGCSCVCEEGWKFDEHGYCEPSEVSEFESELLMEAQGTTSTIKVGDEIKVPPSGDSKLMLKCKDLQDQIALIDLIWDVGIWNPFTMNLGSPAGDLVIQIKSLKSKCAELGVPLEVKGINQKNSKLRTLGADAISLPAAGGSSPDAAVELSLDLIRGPFRVEVHNDQVSLNVETPVATVCSSGKNIFGVVYDPNSGRTFMAAYQNSILIKPNNNQASFTLGFGQQVEVSSNGLGPITAIGQTTSGSAYVRPNGKDITAQQAERRVDATKVLKQGR